MKKLLLLCSVAALVSCTNSHRGKTWMYRLMDKFDGTQKEEVLSDEELLEKMGMPNVTELTMPDLNGSYEKCNKTGRKRLKFISKTLNDITDDDVWIGKYGKGMKNCEEYAFTSGGNQASAELRKIVPTVCNGLYRRYMDVYDDYSVIYYGRKIEYDNFGVDPTLILVTNNSVDTVMYAFDFSKFIVPSYDEYADISVSEVQIEDDVMYASISHPTYSESSNGYNAYLVAVDLRTQTLKWMTKPLTFNSSILICSDVIFTGYGFTAEKDYVYMIDKETGDRIKSYLVDKAPSYFSVIDDKLYVRTYSLDYVFQIMN